MERIIDDEDIYQGRIEEQIDEQDIDNMENLRNNFTKEELVRMCSGFARENMILVHWLYKNHIKVLREFENKHLGGKHIQFAD